MAWTHQLCYRAVVAARPSAAAAPRARPLHRRFRCFAALVPRRLGSRVARGVHTEQASRLVMREAAQVQPPGASRPSEGRLLCQRMPRHALAQRSREPCRTPWMLRRRALLLLLTALCVVPATVAMLAGGYTAEHPLRLSTPAPSPGEPAGVQDNSSRALEVALDVRAEAEKQVGRTFSVWEPVAVRTQVVAGTNYQFKVRVSPTEYAFVKVFQPLPYTGKPPEARSAGCSTARSSRSLFVT